MWECLRRKDRERARGGGRRAEISFMGNSRRRKERGEDV